MSEAVSDINEDKPKPKKKKSGFFWLMVIGIGVAMPGASFILITGMIPTIVMYIIERRKPRYLTYCVGSFNFVGTLPYFLMLCQGSQSLKQAFEVLGSSLPWLIMYGASTIGLAIYSVVPAIVKIIRYIQLNTQIEDTEKQKSLIIQEWGEKIKELDEEH